MTGPERGYLLLCGELGDGLTPLTLPQLKQLRLRMEQASLPEDPDRPLEQRDLARLGLPEAAAARIKMLLDREQTLDAYLAAAAEREIGVMTLISPGYPRRLLRLGNDAPAVLFYRGEPALLDRPTVSLTGSRELLPGGAAFARRAGLLAAREGRVLVSGDARGADKIAQEACMAAGGCLISVVPHELQNHWPLPGRRLFLCEQGWHLPFSGIRALRRNRLIYALADLCLVAQTGDSGGTFRGASEHLKRSAAPLYVRLDDSPGCRALLELGAIGLRELTALSGLAPAQLPLELAAPTEA